MRQANGPVWTPKLRQLSLWVLLAGLATFVACTFATDDSVNPSVRPSTRLIVDSIGRQDSLSTRIALSWSGQVADGYVVGYRIFWSFAPVGNPDAELNNQPLVTREDSTFLFTLRGLPGGKVYFYVRAEDNRGRTGTFANLNITVKNFPPTATIQTSGLPVASDVFSVLTIPVAVTDIDGNETVDSLFVKINEGNWFPVYPKASLISIVGENPMVSGAGRARVYSTVEGTSIVTRQEPGFASGLVIGDSNMVYIRCRDLAGAFSPIRSTERKFFVRRQTSDLLLVDSYITASGPDADAINTSVVNQVYPAGYDKIDLFADGNAYQPVQPRLWRVAFGLTLRLYKKVYWYSDVANTINNNVADGNSALVQTASPALRDYLDNNGKLMLSCRNYIIPDGTPNTRSYPNGSLITRILSIDTILNNDLNVRIPNNATVGAVAGTGFPDLRMANVLTTGFMPFRNSGDATPLYTTTMTRGGSPYRDNLVALRKQNAANGRTNLVFFSMDFHLMSGDANAQAQAMDRILNQEFNW